MNEQQIAEFIQEDIARLHVYRHGSLPHGPTNYWAPKKLTDTGVLGRFQDRGDGNEATVSLLVYLSLRNHPLVQVGGWKFVPASDPIEEIRLAHQQPTRAGHKLADLKQINAELLDSLQNLHDACEHWKNQDDPVLQDARAVIAKAEDGQ